MTVALVQPVVRNREVGLAFGMVETLNSLAMMIAPILAGLMYDWRPVSIYPISLLVLVLALVVSSRYFNGRRGGHRAEKRLIGRKI
jgi:MFS family permease